MMPAEIDSRPQADELVLTQIDTDCLLRSECVSGEFLRKNIRHLLSVPVMH